MICKVCNIDNSESSKFCIECGIGLNNGNEKNRVVSAEEMKNYLWSFDFSKIKDKTRLNRMIHTEMQKWRQDPYYIPIISAPTKTIQKTVSKEMIEWNEQEGRFVSRDSEGKYTVEERLKKNYYDATRDSNPCGMCGNILCSIKHKPTIQQQYQEAFENIQKIRKMRHDRWSLNRPFPMYNIRSGFSRISVPEEMQFIKSRITGTDVRKGIKPKPSERRGKPPNKTSYPTTGMYK